MIWLALSYFISLQLALVSSNIWTLTKQLNKKDTGDKVMYSVLSESTYKHAPDSSHACCYNLTGENEENGLTE